MTGYAFVGDELKAVYSDMERLNRYMSAFKELLIRTLGMEIFIFDNGIPLAFGQWYLRRQWHFDVVLLCPWVFGFCEAMKNIVYLFLKRVLGK